MPAYSIDLVSFAVGTIFGVILLVAILALRGRD